MVFWLISRSSMRNPPTAPGSPTAASDPEHRWSSSGARRYRRGGRCRGGPRTLLGCSAVAIRGGRGRTDDAPVLSEPPLRFGQNEPPADLPDRLQGPRRPTGERGGGLERDDVGMPEPAIEQLRVTGLRRSSSRSRRPPSTTTGSSRGCRRRTPRCWESTCRRRSSAATHGAVDRHRRRATCCRDAGDGAYGRAGVTRPWRRPHRHRSRGARPNRLIIAVRGAARTVGRTRAA